MIVSSPLSFFKPISKNAHKRNETHKTNKKGNIFQRGSKRQIGNVSAHSFWRINRFLFETQSQRLQSKRKEQLPQNCNENRRKIQDVLARIQATTHQAAWKSALCLIHAKCTVKSGNHTPASGSSTFDSP